MRLYAHAIANMAQFLDAQGTALTSELFTMLSTEHSSRLWHFRKILSGQN